jgi:hypothetical protein
METSSVRVRFVLGVDLVSRLIAWAGAGEFSHVDAVLPDGQLFGARTDCNPGVQARPFGYAPAAIACVYDIPCSPEQREAFYKFLWSQHGKSYDRLAIVAFIVNRNWRSPDKWFCSELIAAALEHAGIIAVLSGAVNKVAPSPLAVLLSSHHGVTHHA